MLGEFINKQYPGRLDLYNLVRSRAYSVFNNSDLLSPLEKKAHWMRSYAHAWAYHYPEVGDYDPFIGRVLWIYRENGVCSYISVNASCDDIFTINWFFAGTHNPAGVVRDLHPITNAKDLDAIKELCITDALSALQKFFREKSQKRANVIWQFHGHSLGGHDAQVMACEMMKQKLLINNYMDTFEIIINSQNSLKISQATHNHFLENAPSCPFQITCHHGVVQGDVVQTAGWYLLGYEAETLQNVAIELIQFHPKASLSSLETHTVPTHATNPILVEANQQSWLIGSTATNMASAALGSLCYLPMRLITTTLYRSPQSYSDDSLSNVKISEDPNTSMVQLDTIKAAKDPNLLSFVDLFSPALSSTPSS